MAIKNHPMPKKGSQEAKDLMAQVRAHKQKKRSARSYDQLAEEILTEHDQKASP